MSKRFNGERRTGDPGDTRAFLRSEGWALIKEENGREFWTGWYEAGDKRMPGAIVRTASGRRLFFVRNPSDQFREAAHQGGCFMRKMKSKNRLRDRAVKNAWRLHFDRKPDAVVDGLRRIEAMM